MNQIITTGPDFHFASVWEPSSNHCELSTPPTPADEGRVPDDDINSALSFLHKYDWAHPDMVTAAATIAALRADRDAWRKKAMSYEATIRKLTAI